MGTSPEAVVLEASFCEGCSYNHAFTGTEVYNQRPQYKVGVVDSLCLPCASCRLVQSNFCPCRIGFSTFPWKSARVPRHPGLALHGRQKQ